MTDPAPKSGWAGRQPILWGLAFTAVLAAIAWFEHQGILGGWRSIPFMAGAALLLIPLAKSASNRQASCGTLSPAMARYNRRSAVWSIAYVAALGVAVTIRNRLHPDGALLFAIAILPSVPLMYFIWSMVRYLREETDEYLRNRAISAALAGLGLLLVVATVWGFLETFKVAPHADSWLAVPVWAIGMGLSNLWLMRRDRAGGGE